MHGDLKTQTCIIEILVGIPSKSNSSEWFRVLLTQSDSSVVTTVVYDSVLNCYSF